jgi:hypothetical protein
MRRRQLRQHDKAEEVPDNMVYYIFLINDPRRPIPADEQFYTNIGLKTGHSVYFLFDLRGEHKEKAGAIFTFGHQFPVRFLHPLFLPTLINDLRAQVKYRGSAAPLASRLFGK